MRCVRAMSKSKCTGNDETSMPEQGGYLETAPAHASSAPVVLRVAREGVSCLVPCRQIRIRVGVQMAGRIKLIDRRAEIWMSTYLLM